MAADLAARSPADIVAWRDRIGVTQEQAARMLDVSVRGYQFWEIGNRPISRTVQLACRYLEEHPELR